MDEEEEHEEAAEELYKELRNGGAVQEDDVHRIEKPPEHKQRHHQDRLSHTRVHIQVQRLETPLEIFLLKTFMIFLE